MKRQRPRRDSEGSHESDRPSSPKYTRNRSASPSSQSERGRSSSPEDRSFSGSGSEGRGKSPSPARSSGSGQSQKNTSIQIKNLSTRPGDGSIKDALFHEFKKVGEIVNIKILGTEKDRYALIKFRRSEDAEKSLQSNNKTFLGNEMKISIFKGENKDKEGEANFNMYRKKHRSKDFGSSEDVGFDPMATRTLFVGNLDKVVTHGELRKIFEKFGDVVDIDIKKQNPGITTYAFLQFVDINGAMRAKHRMDREFIGRNRIKVGYGRGTPTNVLWLGNLPQNPTEGQIQRQFHPFGYVKRVIFDRQCCQGLLSFDTVDAATAAFENMRGRFVLGRKILVDFASRSCKEGFYDRMERSGQLDRRNLEPSPPPARPTGPLHQGFQGSYGRARVSRGGFEKGYGYTGRYGSGRGEFGDYPQGAQDYYPESYYMEDDYDDYEKELRDYGHRQRERERERESGRRPERDSSRHRERGEYYVREKTRDRKRAFTPLSDDDQAHVFEGRSDEDDDDYNGKDIQSKVVLPNIEAKDQNSPHDISPDAVKDQDKKPEKKEKRKKKDKKEKSSKKKAERQISDAGADKDVLTETDGGRDKVGEEKADEDKVVKPEKKKKRKSSEKGHAAEDKARKKELKKLKKLKKLQAELGKNEEPTSLSLKENNLGEVFPLKKEEPDEHVQTHGEAHIKEADKQVYHTTKEEEIEDFPVEKTTRTPPTPGLEEDNWGEEKVDVLDRKEGKKEEKEKGEIDSSESEGEKVKDLEKKGEELRKLDREEKKEGKKGESSEKIENKERKVDNNGLDGAKNEYFESNAINRNEDSDSDHSDLVIDEMDAKEESHGDSQMDVSSSKDPAITDKVAEELADKKEIDATEAELKVDIEDAGNTVAEVEKVNDGSHVRNETKSESDERAASLELKKDAKNEAEGKGGVMPDLKEDDKLLAVKECEEVAKEEQRRGDDSGDESDSSKNAAAKDIYSSQSDSSGDLEDIDDEEDDNSMDIDHLKRDVPASGHLKDSALGPSSPGRTPPTPDLEEDTLRMQGTLPGYTSYSKSLATGEKDGSPFVESDEEKKELEKSMKEANYKKRMTAEDRKRHKKDRLGKQTSSSSDHDSDLGKIVKSPNERNRKDEGKSKRDFSRETQASPFKRTLESDIKSFRGSSKDSPDIRDRKEVRRGESPQQRESASRHRSSLETRPKSPELRRFSPDRSRREPLARKGSSERSLSPRRRHSLEHSVERMHPTERRPVVPRGRERDLKEGRRRDEIIDDNREFRENRGPREPDFRNDREVRDTRDNRDRGFREQVREARDFREGRDIRDVRGNEQAFRGGIDERNKDRIGRDRIFNRDRDVPGRGRDDLPDRGFERGGPRAYREPFRDQERPGRHTPPLPPEQRVHSPLQRYPVGVDRRPRSPESRHEVRRPRTPEHMRPRSPMGRVPERRRGRSTERRQTPPRSHEREHEFHRKDTERPNYRDQPERREKTKDRERREKIKEETPPPPPPPPEPRKEQRLPDPAIHQQPVPQLLPGSVHVDSPGGTPGSAITPSAPNSGGTSTPAHFTPPPPPPPTNADTLLDLLRRYPVMWQGLFALKNDSAAVQMHFLSGNVRLAEASLPRSVLAGEVPPPLRISQRMKLEASQLDGVNKRIKVPNDHCMLLALPCGRDPLDVHAQTRALKTGFITYLQVKQAAGIINIVNSATKQPAYVLHIFPPCKFAQAHLARVAPDLLDSAADSGHLMVLITPV
ncbi:msx2-interacting protein-like isoform X2 [Rhopilema esculentum]